MKYVDIDSHEENILDFIHVSNHDNKYCKKETKYMNDRNLFMQL